MDGTSPLRYFVTVAEELHFGRAAKKLHISQRLLSMQIRAPETERGVTLFNRTQRSVALTQSGNALLGEARHILARVEQAVLMTKWASRGELGKLAIGFISVADYNVLPVVLREFRRAFPLVNLTLRESTTDAQICDLLTGRIDVGFGLPPINEPSLAGRRDDELPALRVFADVASRTANLPRKTRSSA